MISDQNGVDLEDKYLSTSLRRHRPKKVSNITDDLNMYNNIHIDVKQRKPTIFFGSVRETNRQGRTTHRKPNEGQRPIIFILMLLVKTHLELLYS